MVKAYLQRQCVKIMKGQISLQDFTFGKEYRGRGGYRPGACVPALELSRFVDLRNMQLLTPWDHDDTYHCCFKWDVFSSYYSSYMYIVGAHLIKFTVITVILTHCPPLQCVHGIEIHCVQYCAV